MIDQLQLMNFLFPQSPNPMSASSGMSSDVDIQEIARQLQDQQMSHGPMLKNDAEMRLRDLITQMPNRDNYKPGVGRRIMAGMAGLGGNAQNVEQTLYAPYHRAMNDWQTKLKPIGELADAERASNTNERLINSSRINAENTSRRLDETERMNVEKTRQADEKIEIQRGRAEVYKYKAEHPNKKSVIDENGYVVMVGQDGESINTGINTGKWTDEQKIEAGIEGRIRVVNAQGQQQKVIEGIRQGNRIELEKLDQEGQIDLRKTPGAGGGNIKAPTEAQNKIGKMNLYNQIISEHPELKKYYIVKDGNVSVKPLDTGYFSTEKEADRNTAYNLLFPANRPSNNSSKDNTRVKPSEGKVHVRRKSDGVSGWVTNPNTSIYELIP